MRWSLPPAAWEPWRVALFLGAYYAAVGAFMPYFPLYLEHRGISAGEIGVLMAAAQATRIIGPAFWGGLADRVAQRQRIAQWTAVATAVLFALLLAPGGFWWLLPVFFATQFCGTGQMPVCEAIIASHLRGDAHAAARYGRLRVWGSVGFVATVLALGPVLDRFGIAAQPWLVVAALALTAAAAFLLRDAPPSLHAHERVSVRARLAEPRVRWFFASVVLMIFAHGALYSFFSLHLKHLGYNKTEIGAFWILGVLVEIAFFYVQGHFFRRFGLRSLLAATFALAALRFALIAQFAHIVALLVIAQALHAASFAAHHSASILTVQRWFAGASAARGQALYVSLGYGVGGTAGSLAAAWLWSTVGPSAAFLASSAAALLGWWAVRRSHRLDVEAPPLARAASS